MSEKVTFGLVFCLAYAVMAGCERGTSAEDSTVDISGNVTIDDQAVKEALLIFEPKNRKSRHHVFPVRHGAFSSEPEAPLLLGEYEVRLQGRDPEFEQLALDTETPGQLQRSIATQMDAYKKLSPLSITLEQHSGKSPIQLPFRNTLPR